ncbi:MAG: hypothetical protein ACRDNZ_24060, partial [Streptosporangiaceae bacterium]
PEASRPNGSVVAQITKSMQEAHPRLAGLVPQEILKSIDQAELADRLAFAAQHVAKSRTAPGPVAARALTSRARAILSAQPRSATEGQVARLMSRAAAAPGTPRSQQLRRQAAALLTEYPPAPRRNVPPRGARVIKGRATGLSILPVFTAKGIAGGLVGVVDEEFVQPARSPEDQARDTGPVTAGGTTGLGRPRATGPAGSLPADGPQAARPGDLPGRTIIKASGDSDLVGVFDLDGNLVGVCDAADIEPVASPKPPPGSPGNPKSLEPQPSGEAGTPASGPGAATAADEAAVAKARAVVVTKAAELKDRMYNGATAVDQARAATQLNQLAIAGLSAVHGNRAQGRPRR